VGVMRSIARRGLRARLPCPFHSDGPQRQRRKHCSSAAGVDEQDGVRSALRPIHRGPSAAYRRRRHGRRGILRGVPGTTRRKRLYLQQRSPLPREAAQTENYSSSSKGR